MITIILNIAALSWFFLSIYNLMYGDIDKAQYFIFASIFCLLKSIDQRIEDFDEQNTSRRN